jgi:competence protein ComEA
MIMKRKLLMTGILFGFFIIAGICYSCTFKENDASSILASSAGTNGEEQNPVQDLPENNPNKNNPSEKPTTEPATVTENMETNKKQTKLYVHICGAVMKPGVYKVNNGDRLIDLIDLAGGLSKNAAGDYVNQAQGVTDGQRIYIPTEEEVKELTASEYIAGDQSVQDETEDTGTLININEADAKELMNLPGIGQAKADSIIEYRKSVGKFKTIEELMNIPGIKEGLFHHISSYVTVN